MIGSERYIEARRNCIEEHLTPVGVYVDFTLNPALRPRIKKNAAFLRVDVNLGDAVVGERLDEDECHRPPYSGMSRVVLGALPVGEPRLMTVTSPNSSRSITRARISRVRTDLTDALRGRDGGSVLT